MERLLKMTLLVLAIMAASVYGYLFWGGRLARRSPGADPAPSQPSVELWDAYERAQVVAQTNATAAPAVSASAQWQRATPKGLLTGASQWSFKFYAAESAEIVHVVVGGEAARLAGRTSAPNAPTTLREGAWLDGPRDPLLVFLAHGGRDFLEKHREAVVSVHLAEVAAEGASWDVAALSTENGSVLAVCIDAETLKVRSTSSGDGEA